MELAFLSPLVASGLRHALSFAGGVLVSKGIVEQSIVENAASSVAELVVGVGFFFVAPLLSQLAKKKK